MFEFDIFGRYIAIIDNDKVGNCCAIGAYYDIGSERYKIAHRYIRSNLKAFDTEKGMEVLKQAQSMSEIYPTRSSMVFDPYKKEIFICLEGNFDKICKISLLNQSIETWRGFASFRREPIPAEGVSGADLAQW